MCVCVCVCVCVHTAIWYLLGPQKWWLLLLYVIDDDYEDDKSYWTPPVSFFKLCLTLVNSLSTSHPSVLLYWKENNEKMQSIFYSSSAFDNPQEFNTNTYLAFQTPTKIFGHPHSTPIQPVASAVPKTPPHTPPSCHRFSQNSHGPAPTLTQVIWVSVGDVCTIPHQFNVKTPARDSWRASCKPYHFHSKIFITN